MIRPEEILKKSNRLYSKYLQQVAAGQPFEKIILPCDKKPSKDFECYRREHDALHGGSKAVRGFGYAVTWETVNHKTLGRQALPQEIAFETETDLLRLLHKEREMQQFRKDLAALLAVFPQLQEWVCQYPQKVVDYAGEWPDLLKVLVYFAAHPQPRLYIRELPIEVHTKFIEQHKGILRELLDLLLGEAVNTAEPRFEARYHLRYSEELVRLRFLDADLSRTCAAGLRDLSLPVSECCALDWQVKVVFVVENKVNFLTFPPVPGALIIWGHGYGVASLQSARFLQQTPLYYWGDLDAQGFEILSQFRGYFPQTRSLFMDRTTFDRFFENDEGSVSHVAVALHLTPEEQAVYDLVKEHNWRLEQEKIPQRYVLERLPALLREE